MMKLKTHFTEFFNSEKSGGLILVFVAVLSLIVSNSSLGGAYSALWNYQLFDHTLTHWVNDGLMAIFFLLIGLELEREIRSGELSELKKASLPIFAAIGGMIVPALIYAIFNYGTDKISGAAIPMATDIAFAIGILSLLSNRVPPSLKLFLTALAVIDDLGAIVIIALFYSTGIVIMNLLIALGIWIVLLVMKKFKVNNLIPYIVGGFCMWYFMLHSGVHATIAGVLLAFALPVGDGNIKSPSLRLQRLLHMPVPFIILPVFAAANTVLPLENYSVHNFNQSEVVGIICGLCIGKPLGISLFALLAVSTGVSVLPTNITWRTLISTSVLGGIGFTMSIFITLLAFDQADIINNSKIAILLSSFVSGFFGYILLKKIL